MNTPRRDPLEWISLNRQPHRPQTIGALASKLVEPKVREVPRREAVRSCIGWLVDDTFRRLCTLGKVGRRSVEILVDHPTAAVALRRQWLMCLVEHLDRHCRFVVSPRIDFNLGAGGDRFTSPEANQAVEGQTMRDNTDE
ncbi:MAG: hypothetical protein KAV82_05365 [Phycisphaerae bacterium]|nr:hypothetical protein [Phycisphaerae bacterium]